MRESAADKGARLLAEGKVRVYAAKRSGIAARIVGDTGVHRSLLYLRDGREYAECDCTAGQVRPGKATCSHIAALRKLWPPI